MSCFAIQYAMIDSLKETSKLNITITQSISQLLYFCSVLYFYYSMPDLITLSGEIDCLGKPGLWQDGILNW